MFSYLSFLSQILAYVGDPLSYAQFAAKAAGAGVDAAAAAVAGRAVVGALAANFAAIVGTFLLGYGIGQAILGNLSPGTLIPELQDGLEGGDAGVAYEVFYSYEARGLPVFNRSSIFVGPIGPVIYQTADGIGYNYYLLTGAGRSGILNINKEDVVQAPFVTGARKVNGEPANLRRVPQIPQKAPISVPFRVPDTIPISPTIPDLPVFPEVYPITPFTPDAPPEKAYPPGVTVKIPETGDQYIFTPNGVFQSKYTPEPKVGFNPYVPPYNPTNQKPAETECPCPEESKSQKELLCRVKALQNEILDDGYTTALTFVAAAQSVKVGPIDGVFNKLLLNVTQVPANVKIQSYPLPATDVGYYGWYCLLCDGQPYERMPLFALEMTVPIPEKVNGYMIGCNDGVLCSSAYGKETKRPYIDGCQSTII